MDTKSNESEIIELEHSYWRAIQERVSEFVAAQ